ncbi:hypothetical protein [Epilithonimonas sp. UC225_85]|uniref:hypothetical protein n=1 Tax=Epilithonimonas sp. UC225_85 TaxID=3350167 RepID=UPI0036D307BF
MKKNLFLIVLFINVFCLGQTKIYLDKNISIVINQEFNKKKLSINEVNKFIENEKLEKSFIKDKKYLENQDAYIITDINNPKSFINVNINKVIMPESVNNLTMDKSDELKSLFTNYIDSKVSENLNQFEKGSAQFINKTKMLSINGVNVLLCTISTSLKVKENDILNAKSDILYIFNDTTMIVLSIAKSEADYSTWEKIANKIIQSINKE